METSELMETNEAIGQDSRPGYTPGAADSPGSAEEVSPEIASARTQIEATREQMTETIDAIKEQLSPAHLVEEAKESIKESIKEATIGKAEQMLGSVVDLAKAAARQ
jgi:hypothetical protein